jgi:nitrous oxidase accessory protein NosD/nitrous oxide reductase accessory protein NosL
MNPKPILAILLVTLLASGGAFVAAPGSSNPDPVAFDDTIRTGMTAATTLAAAERGAAIPRAQVFYSQYRYVVGYYGVTTLVDELDRRGQTRQFGHPLTVYVTDYSMADLRVDDEGLLRVPATRTHLVDWVAASDAHFIVGSSARTPTGPAVVPFGSRSAATTFADEYGGEVHDWAAVRSLSFDTATQTREAFTTAVRERHAWADRRVDDARTLRDRPVSVTVGDEGAETLSAAVAAADPGTTVYVPPGTYDANVTVDKPVTIRGAGEATHLRGDGTGTVVTATADRVGVVDLRITGVGETQSPENVSTNRSGEWDYRVQLGYGYGDAGVALAESNESLVSGVTVDTPTNGVVARFSQSAVVEDVRVTGSDDWQEGFMGVMVMRSRIVVQNSTFVGGRDGVYTHLSDGLVVRNNRFVGNDTMRFGVHEMYTSEALVANNTVSGARTGIVVMTRPSGNLVVDNVARDNYAGINVAGRASYVAGNVVTGNHYGLEAPARTSLWERNVVARNDVGVRASSLIPTNRVVRNDFVDNGRPVQTNLGPLRIWTGAGGGNYWADAPGVDADGDGVIERTYRPTGPVDERVGTASGAGTLAQSPALSAVRALQGVVPGLRPTGVVDEAPLAEPVRPAVVANVTAGETSRHTATEA